MRLVFTVMLLDSTEILGQYAKQDSTVPLNNHLMNLVRHTQLFPALKEPILISRVESKKMIASHVLQPMLVKKRVCRLLQVPLIKSVLKDSGASQVPRRDGQSLNALATTVHVQLGIIAKKELRIL